MPNFKAFGNNENGWYENGIYKAAVKEMAMAHSSYARAAGIQSEISKVTVTRVASSEVECKRQTNVYKKDMIITINNISREQRILRKAMVRYSKKKKQHRLIKEKREKELLEKERREREDLEKWEQIHALLNVNDDMKEENGEENQDSDNHGVKTDDSDKTVENDSRVLNDENNNNLTLENKAKRTKKKNSKNDSEEKDLNLNPFEVLPAITEADNEQETNLENEQDGNTPDIKPSTSDTKQSSEEESSSSLSPLFALTLRPLKPKKQIVSFSDIIKLKHSHNTNKLFDMVHTLAERHGVNESIEKRRAERRNSRIPKGSTDAVISESLRKAASVIYPMKFGYGDHESNNREKFEFDNNSVPETTDISTEPNVSEKSDKNSSSGTPSSKKMKRNKTTSGFTDEMKKLRKEEMLRNGITEEEQRFTHVSTRSKSSKLLPAIISAKSSPNNSRSNSVSWTEAFGLLKIVHSID